MLPTYQKQNILIRSFSYLPPWYRLEKVADPTTTAGTAWKEFGRPEFPALLCTRPLFYYLAPYVLMFTNAVTEQVFLLLVEAPTIMYAQKLALFVKVSSDQPSEERESSKLLTLRALSALHRITFLQELVIWGLDLEETRLVAIEQIGQLHRLESLSWPSIGCTNSFSAGGGVISQFPSVTTDGHEGEGKPESTAKFLASVPLVKFSVTFRGDRIEFNLVASQISRTLRRLTITSSGSKASVDREMLDVIATNCPQLTHLQMTRLAVEDEHSLEPLQRLCRLKKLDISTIVGFESVSDSARNSRNRMFGLRSRNQEQVPARSEEDIRKCQRSLRFLRACSGELEELSILGTRFGSDLSIASLFGFPSEQVDDEGDGSEGRGKIDPTERRCVWPRLSLIELSLEGMTLRTNSSTRYFDSISFPTLKSLFLSNFAFAEQNDDGLEVGSSTHHGDNTLASLGGLERLILPNLVWTSSGGGGSLNYVEAGVCLLNLLTRAASSPNRNDADDYDENVRGWRPTCIADSLHEFSVSPATPDRHPAPWGFTSESVNKFLQRTSCCSFGRKLKSIHVTACPISNEFIRLISEDKNLQRTLRDLTLGDRNVATTNVTDEGIFHLRHLSRSLLSLSLSNFSAITDEGAANVVQHLVRLKSLSLVGCSLVGDLVCAALVNHHELECLDLHETAVTGKTFASISTNCHNLSSLYLSWCAGLVDVELLAPLNRLFSLTYVDIARCPFLSEVGSDELQSITTRIYEVLLPDVCRRGCYINNGY